MKSEYQNHIINKIRKLRTERGISQSRLALLLGISNGQIGNIESLKSPHKYTLAQLYEICHEFDFPIEELFMEQADVKYTKPTIDSFVQKIIQYEQ